jgi:ribosome-binding protein aMBF1 (putative translation factor)
MPVDTHALCRADRRLHPVEVRRLGLGLSRAALSQSSGVSASCIYQVERKGVQPTRPVKILIGMALGITDVSALSELFRDV